MRETDRAHRERLYREGCAEAPPIELDHATKIQAIVNCGLCDDDGYHGNRVCDHREHSTPAGRQAAKDQLRRALSKGGK